MKQMKHQQVFKAVTLIVSAMLLAGLALGAPSHMTAQAATSTLVSWTKAYDQSSRTANTYSFAIPSGTNRILVVGIALTSNAPGASVSDPTTATYGGVSLTKATSNGASTGRMHTWLYYLKDNSTVMDNTSRVLMIIFPGGTTLNNLTVYYTVYAGVNQTPTSYVTGNGFDNTDGSGPAQLSSPMAVAAGAQAVYISSIRNTSSTTIPGYTINAAWTSGGSNSGTPAGEAYKDEVASRSVPTADTTDNSATSTITPAGSIRFAISAMVLPAAPVDTTTTVACDPASVDVHTGTSCTATVTAASGGINPTGTVTFSSDGSGAFSPANTCSLAAGNLGKASCSVTYTPSQFGTGSHKITASYGGASIFIASAGDITLIVNKITLTVSGITASDKMYDGTIDATLDTSAAALVGVVEGDTVTLDKASAAGAFATKDVGTDKVVTVSGLGLTGADAGNYSLTQPTTTASITKATLTVTGVTAANKVYDGTTTATLDLSGATLVGVIGTDVVAPGTTATGTFATKDVGTDKVVTVSGLGLTGADAGNYSLTQPTTTANITPRALTVSATGVNKAYDGTTVATVILSDNRVAGDVLTVSYGSASFADKNIGMNKIVTVTGITVTGIDAGNYTWNTTAMTTANITGFLFYLPIIYH